MRKVCVIVTARPSWAKLEPVCRALQARADVELQIVACASALLERYGRVVDVIQKDYEIAAEVWSTYEGANLLTSAKETGALLVELAAVLQRLSPSVVCVCADRHEVLAVAQAAAYLHLPLAHLQGGERTGSIDDKIRDGVTSLADLHFPCTKLAAYRVYGLTGAYERIFHVGCPSIDVAKQAQDDPPVTAEELGGAGAPIDLSKPFGIVLQHPVTSEADDAATQMWATLEAADTLSHAIVFWPGQDAGGEHASKAIRQFQALYGEPFHTVRNLPPRRFLRLLTQCACLIGNSSAGIREASYLGTPVVNVGSRQYGRERAGNVVDVPHEAQAIADAITRQVEHGRYPSSTLYGQGNSGTRIAEVLANVTSDRVGAGAGGLQGHTR